MKEQEKKRASRSHAEAIPVVREWTSFRGRDVVQRMEAYRQIISTGEEDFDPARRLLCEMELCTAMEWTALPKGFRLWSGIVFSNRHHDPQEPIGHIFAQNMHDQILCITPGQFVSGTYARGSRIQELQRVAPKLFYPLQGEESVLFGNRWEIRDRLGIRYHPLEPMRGRPLSSPMDRSVVWWE